MEDEGGPYRHRSAPISEDMWACRVCGYVSHGEPPAASARCPAGVSMTAELHRPRRPTTEGEDRALREFWRGGG